MCFSSQETWGASHECFRVRAACLSDGWASRFYRGMSASYAGISETVIHFVIYESIKRRLLEAKAATHMDGAEDTSKTRRTSWA